MVKLGERRMVWVPTALGWLLLILALGIALAMLGRGLYAFLAVNEPVEAAVLVVEGWLDPAGLDQALVAFRRGRYERVLTTGGPIQHWPGIQGPATFAERAASYLKAHGLADVTAIPAPASAQDRTFLSAVMVREWVTHSGRDIRKLDVLSQGAHARRSRLVYRLALGREVEVGVLATTQSPDLTEWWRTATGAREILDQTVALAWTKLFFWPPPPGSHEERWAAPH